MHAHLLHLVTLLTVVMDTTTTSAVGWGFASLLGSRAGQNNGNKLSRRQKRWSRRNRERENNNQNGNGDGNNSNGNGNGNGNNGNGNGNNVNGNGNGNNGNGNGNNVPDDGTDVPTGGDNSSPLVQFTPDQADWDGMNAATANVPSVIDHSPDGVTWAVNYWPSWDGTIINLKGLTGKQVQSAICERGIIRGTRELYYEKPFADPKAPTKAEVDDLHIRTIRHIRKMVGIDQLVPVSFDRCLCSIALWSAQLHATSIWDSKYPGAKKTNCINGGPHCNFVPNPKDQTHTFDGVTNNQTCTTSMPEAEGVGGTNADIPWSLKFHRSICQFLAEGTVGHAGPIFRREKLCPSFFFSGVGNSAEMRLKSGGNFHNVLPFDSSK